MDTLFDMPEFRKLIEYTVSASIIGVLVFSQSLIFNSPIFADDMQVAHVDMPVMSIDTGQIKELSLIHISEPTRPY